MALLIIIVMAIIASFPATWLLMLFLGNVGLHLGFWGALPGGILLTLFIGALSGAAGRDYGGRGY